MRRRGWLRRWDAGYDATGKVRSAAQRDPNEQLVPTLGQVLREALIRLSNDGFKPSETNMLAEMRAVIRDEGGHRRRRG